MPLDLVRRWTLTAAAVLAASAAVLPVGVVGTASADDCPAIEVIFARGTTEDPGLGAVGGAFVNSLRGKVGGRSVGTYAINYPASYDFLDAAVGANDASGHIQYMAGACPDTKLVLGGYSQGAAVVDVVSAVPFPAAGFTNPLPDSMAPHVAAIAVFGNPSAKLGMPLTVSPTWGARAIDLCNGGDPVCQTTGESVAAHKAYAGGPTNQAANFVAGLV